MTASAWSLSARDAADGLSRGDFSPSELLEAVSRRVAAVNPAVNALPTFCFERAACAAKALELKPASERGFFAGLPWPIKDSYPVEGVRTTYGSLAYADHIATHSDFAVEAIEAAGGIVYAKSNTPEFEAGANTFNDVFGRTLNPFDLSRSAGGSSGGAAVAVATGMAFVAQGSDFACSLRFPAAFCNVVGLRPSPGLVPQGPSALPFQVLSVIGPMARTVADTAFALDGMARLDIRDPLSRALSGTSYRTAAESPLCPPRSAFSPNLGIAAVSSNVLETVGRAVAHLASEGLRIEETHPDLDAADRAFRPLRAFQFAALRREALELHRDALKPEVVWNIEQGLKLTAADLASAEAERSHLRSEMLRFLDVHHVLITPTAPVEPFPVEQRYVDEIDGRKLDTYLDWMMLGYAITITGCPAISIPCGRTARGLPVGLQIVGRPYDEATLLRTAAWCEAVLGCALAGPIDPAGTQ